MYIYVDDGDLLNGLQPSWNTHFDSFMENSDLSWGRVTFQDY